MNNNVSKKEYYLYDESLISSKITLTTFRVESEEEIKNKVASKINTLPIFLNIEEKDNMFIVYDLKDLIEKHVIKISRKLDLVIFENFYQYLIDMNFLLTKELNKHLITLYLYYISEPMIELHNKKIGDIDHLMFQNLNLEEFNKQLNKSDVMIDINKTIKDVDGVLLIDKIINNRNFIMNEIENNKVKVKTNDNFYSTIYNLIGVDYSDFREEQGLVEYSLNILNRSLLDLFNEIVLSAKIPFAKCKGFFKIKKSISSDSRKIIESLENDTNLLVLYFECKDNSVIEIKIDEQFKIKYEFNINLCKNDVIQEELKKVIPIGIEFSNKVYYKIQGDFYLVNEEINNYIFKDLVLNNKLFSSLFFIDESKQITKESLNIKSLNNKIGYLTASITQDLVLVGDKKNNVLLSNYKLGTKYIKVRVRNATKLESIFLFQQIFSKLFYFYKENKLRIKEEYTSLFDNDEDRQNYLERLFTKEQQKEIKITNKKDLKQVEPDIFIVNEKIPGMGQPLSYVRNVCADVYPEYIDDDDEIPENKQALIFPLHIENKVPKKYICNKTKNNNNYFFPGLKKNKLNNTDIYPFLPCCFKTDQTSQMNKINSELQYASLIKAKQVTDGYVITTNKLIHPYNRGVLPNDINTFFKLHSKEKSEYFRVGVPKNVNSLISCLAFAFGEIEPIKEKDPKRDDKLLQQKNIVNDIRKSLVDNYVLCKQQNYDKTTEEIINDILNVDSYFDPLKYVSLLEFRYDCNIYMFSVDNILKDGFMMLPNYKHKYLRYSDSLKNYSVFLFIHSGSIIDNSSYPQCEIITKLTEDTDQLFFKSKSLLCRNSLDIYNSLGSVLYLNSFVSEEEINLINSQVIDSYGKLRGINISINNDDYITILTDTPLPPLNIPINNEIKKISNIEVLKNIESLLNIRFTKKSDGNFYSIINDFKVKIEAENIYQFSLIDNYKKYKKISSYVSEYVFWLYSLYLNNLPPDNLSEIIYNKSDSSLNYFMNNYFTIDNSIQYDNVDFGNNFSFEIALFNNKKQMILKSNETKKRLHFLLQIQLLRHTNELINYKYKSYLVNYFVDFSDFKQIPEQIVITGNDFVKNLIINLNQKENKYILYTKVQPTKRDSYFFYNKKINDTQIFIAKNTNSINKAIQIALNWNNNKSIHTKIVENKDLVDMYNFYLYRFNNENDIDIFLYDCSNNDIENVENIRILFYKFEKQPVFTVLNISDLSLKDINKNNSQSIYLDYSSDKEESTESLSDEESTESTDNDESSDEESNANLFYMSGDEIEE